MEKLSYAQVLVKENKRKYYRLSAVIVLFFLVSLTFSVTSLINVNKPFVILISFLVLVYPVLKLADWFFDKVIDKKFDKFEKNIEHATKGDEGEEIAFKILNDILDRRYYKIFKNFTIPGKEFDIDFLIVGPKGLILIENKSSSTKQLLTQSGTYYEKYGKYQQSWYDDVRNQVKRHREELSQHLLSNGYNNIKIKKAVLFSSKDAVELDNEGKDPYGVYVIQGIGKLKDYINGAFTDNKFTPEFCAELSKLFDK